MDLIDESTISMFYNSAVFQSDSTWMEQVLDKILPINLLDRNEDSINSVTDTSKAVYSLISAKHCSWDSYLESVRQYDNSVACGLVWTKNYYAYRCRTCAISQCMSLCEECFKAGNHEGHDFNLFRSSSGGACDCGDSDVMKDTGFCHRHGERNAAKLPSAPPEVMATARAVVPRLLVLLVMHLRRNYADTEASISGAEWLFAILKDLSGLGAAMLRVLCSAITDERLYADTFVTWSNRRAYAGPEFDAAFSGLDEAYRSALALLPSVLPEDVPLEIGGVPVDERLRHRSLLDELTFWMAHARFPQQLIGLLLSMLPTPGYKAPFAGAFAAHYLRMVSVLCSSPRPPVAAAGANSYQANLSYRVVHISVQLLSASELCQRMCAEHALLERVLIGLDYVLAASGPGFQVRDYRPAGLVDSPEPCRVDHPIMTEHRYWPVVSDLVNMLVHGPVAARLLRSDALLAHYTSLLSRLHAANAGQRALRIAVEQDSAKLYYSAFAADNEIAACTLWTVLAWARTDRRLAARALRASCDAVRAGRRLSAVCGADWLSFHLPVHRMASAFLCALFAGAPERAGSESLDGHHERTVGELAELFSPLDAFMNPPLRALIGYCEINADLWLRNGMQMKGQAMTYVHSSFCCSLVDLDLNLVQAALAALPDKAQAARRLFNLLHLDEYLSLGQPAEDNEFIGAGNMDRAPAMAEWGLQLIAWLLCLHPAAQLAADEAGQLERELIVAVCVEDRSHSQLVDCLPERESAHHEPGRHAALLPTLRRLADLSSSSSASASAASAAGGGVSGGGGGGAADLSPPVYRPRPEVWLELYDPLMTSLRCTHRRQHQAGLDRYARHVAAAAAASERHSGDCHLWPPYRLPPAAVSELPHYLAGVTDLLHTSAMQARLFALLYKFVHNQPVRSSTVSLAVFLLELTLTVPRSSPDTSGYSCDAQSDLGFTSHDLEANLFHEVPTEFGPTSLLGLLLSAHRQLTPGGAWPTLAQLADCRVTALRRVGDGADFVRRVIGLACPPGSAAFERLRRLLGGGASCEAARPHTAAAAADAAASVVAGGPADDPEGRRSAVEERKRKLMDRMVAQQRAFAANYLLGLPDQGDTASATGAESCCICQKSDTDESPFALLALAQTSSILGHRTCPAGRRLWSLLEESHWSDALTELRWGMVVTSCGHSVHCACVQPYITGMDHARLFPCPLCRQNFNLVLPICPGVSWEGPPSPQPLRSRWEFGAGAAPSDSLATPVQTASGQLLSLAQLWSPAPDPSADHERWSFWAGILLTNLRLELCLMDTDERLHARYRAKCCTGQLLRFLMEKSAYELQRRESSAFLTAFLDHFMAGAPAPEDMPFQPLLLQDPGKMLILLVLTAVWKKQQWYAALAAAYNLAYVQSLLAELLAAAPADRLAWSAEGERETLAEHARLLVAHAEHLLRQPRGQLQPQPDPPPPPRPLSQLRESLERRLSPLLRLAALLRCHVTEDAASACALRHPVTFADLCDRLGLGPAADPARLFTPLDGAGLDRLAPAWLPTGGPAGLQSSPPPVAFFADRLALPAELRPPRLARLPAAYDALFSAHRSRTCRQCGTAPPHPALCLVCEEFLCFNSPCCLTRHGDDAVGECHRHAMLCGSGVCLLLVVDSSFVWLFTHGQATRWGSLYLDEFGEEDEELRRGRPLFLSQQRYQLLQWQWLLHNFYSGTQRLVLPSHAL